MIVIAPLKPRPHMTGRLVLTLAFDPRLFDEGGEDRNCPRTLEEMAWEISRVLGVQDGTLGGGNVEVIVAEAPTDIDDSAPCRGVLRRAAPDERLYAARVALLRKAITEMQAATRNCSDMPSLLLLVHIQSATINLLAQAAGLVDGEVPP